MLQISQCKISIEKENDENAIKKKISSLISCDSSKIKDIKIIKKSIDARKKPDIYFSYTIIFSVENEKKVLQKNKKNKDLRLYIGKQSQLESFIKNIENKKERKTVVVGAGPAGLFCAYLLSLCGQKPIIVERGKKIEDREKDVEKFWQDGILNNESNVSFGEGGAGTFSDGKLNTGVKDKNGYKKFILESFVKFGANEDILYDSLPHIGTDILKLVISNMRKEMEKLGCQFMFESRFEEIILANEKISAIKIFDIASKKEKMLECENLVLAIGHSARDTFEKLYKKDIVMVAKPFAVGLRVVHSQEDIDRAQYGEISKNLPAANYKCVGKTSDNRGVYSFCMCPGGYVVNASSKEGYLAVNGMSNSKRDSQYANSAIVVSVGPDDFGKETLSGMYFQEKYEKLAYEICQGRIPVQTLGDLKKNKASNEKKIDLNRIKNSIKGQYALTNLRNALPQFIINGIIEGMEQFGKKIKGFDKDDTLFMGIETRTSSPVRIIRNEDGSSQNLSNLYPCGEGAGYAGGIMSAAMDGLKIAQLIISN